MAGIIAGTYLARFVSPSALKRAFSVFLLVMGTMMLYGNRDALRASMTTIHHALECC